MLIGGNNMFKWIKKFRTRIDMIEDNLNKLSLTVRENIGELKECCACGCLIKTGVKGPPIIKKRYMPLRPLWDHYIGDPGFEFEVYEPLYCYKCAPKPKDTISINYENLPKSSSVTYDKFDEWNW
jgi:hypothetical protein